MPRHRCGISLVLVASVLLALSSGCTVVGYGLGALVDHHAGRHRPPDDRLREAQGSSLRATMRDGSTVRGRLARLECAGESVLVLVQPARTERSVFAVEGAGDTLRVPLREVVEVSTDYISRTVVFCALGSMADVVIGLAILNHQSVHFHPGRPGE